MENHKKQPVKPNTANAKHKAAVKGSKNRIYLYAALIAILTFTVFSNSLKNDYVKNLDDILYYSSADNAKALTAGNISTIFSTNVAGIYHPFTVLSLAAELNVFGEDAMHFHIINLLLHVINTLLVFWFIYLLTRKTGISVIVAVFFGIHPMHVESVAWISERKDVLYTMFFLASLITYLKYLNDEKKIKYILFSLLLFICSLLSKSAAVCLAPMLLLIDYFMKRKLTRKLVIEKIPYFLLALFFGIISLKSQGAAGSLDTISGIFPDYSFFDRIFMISYSFMFYIIKAIIPFSLTAIHYYPDKAGGYLPSWYYMAPLGIAFLVLVFFKFKGIRKDLAFGFLFYLVSIILVLQLITVGYAIVSERYSYVPYIGLFFIIGKLYSDFTENKFNNFTKARKNIILSVIVMFIVLFSSLTIVRNNAWKNDVTLFTDVLSKNPESGHAFWALGNGRYQLKDYPGAIIEYNKAIDHNFKFVDVYNSRGLCYFKMDSLYPALSDYIKAIEVDSTFILAYFNKAQAEQGLKKYKESVDDYKKAIELGVQNPGYVYNQISYSQFMLHEYDDALISINKAIELDKEKASEYMRNKDRIENEMKK